MAVVQNNRAPGAALAYTHSNILTSFSQSPGTASSCAFGVTPTRVAEPRSRASKLVAVISVAGGATNPLALTATTVVVTASLIKQANKPLTATSVVVTASLVAMKVILKALTATTVVVTASLIKQV